jgi:hypothetical protein
MSAGSRITDPELDEALARAIRHLIAEAIEADEGAGTDTETKTTDQAGSAAA